MTKSTLTIDMPECCNLCKLFIRFPHQGEYVQWCAISKIEIDRPSERHPDCPLVDVIVDKPVNVNPPPPPIGERPMAPIMPPPLAGNMTYQAIIANLRAQVNWLCEQLRENNDPCPPDCEDKCPQPIDCMRCWREAAKKAVANGN